MQLYPGGPLRGSFVTSNSTGAATNADALPTAQVAHNGVIDGSVTVSVAAVSGVTGGYYFSATIPSGYAVGDNLVLFVTATISAVVTCYPEVDEMLVSSQAVLVAAVSAAILITPANKLTTDASGDVTLTSAQATELATAAGYSIPSAATIATSVWAVLTSALTTAGSAGAAFVALIASIGTINTNVSSVETTVGTINTNVSSVETTVGTILTDVASVETTVGTISTNVSAVESTVGTINSNVSTVLTDVASIETTVGTILTDVSSVETSVGTILTDVVTIGTEVAALPNASAIATAVAAPSASAIATAVAAPSAATIAAAVWNVVQSTLTVTGTIGYNFRRVIQGFIGANASTYTGSPGAPTAVSTVVKAEDGTTTLDTFSVTYGASGPTSRTVT
jgi:hypothetical protein